jgi:uncharacterized protein (DUF433 family)
MTDYRNHIEIRSDVRFGKPCVKSTRIAVSDILGWLANGMNTSEIITDFPELTLEDVQACLAYAADKEHRTRVIS